jgi:DNA-binding transcriptional MocR family regulator
LCPPFRDPVLEFTICRVTEERNSLPEDANEHETARRARRSGVGLHELHRHCTTYAPTPPALLLGFALPSESDLIAAAAFLAEAIC